MNASDPIKTLPKSLARRGPSTYGSWCSVRRANARWPGPHRLFLGTGTVLMSPHNGAIDHRVFVVGVGGEVVEDAATHAGGGPPAEACVHILPMAEPLRKIAPGNAGAIAVEYRLNE